MLINTLSLALCPLPCHRKRAQTPALTSHLQLALVFLLPGYKWNMWRNAAELPWDGHFITGIYPRVSWENSSAFYGSPCGGRARWAAPTAGLALLLFYTTGLMLSCQCQQSTGKNYPAPRSVKLRVDLCPLSQIPLGYLTTLVPDLCFLPNSL